MSDTPSSGEPEDRPQSVQTAGSTLADVEKRFLRLTFWQTILSVAGVFTGAVALYAALTESQAVRQQTAASVWPYIQVLTVDQGEGEAATFAVTLTNVGVGPARLRGIRLSHNATPVRDWASLTRELMGAETTLGRDYGKQSMARRVLAPQESLTVFQSQNPQLATALREAAYSGAIALEFCYCSIFDDCWVSASNRGTLDDVTPVAQCPDYGDASFVE